MVGHRLYQRFEGKFAFLEEPQDWRIARKIGTDVPTIGPKSLR